MHRVLLIHDNSTKYDILTASDHRNSNGYGVLTYLQLKTTEIKQGMKSIDIFILAYFRINYKKISRKLPENSSVHAFVIYNI